MSYADIILPGGRQAVILIHGLTGGPFEMSQLAKKLNKAGFTVHVPLLAGHGSSIDDLKKTHWQDWYGTVRKTTASLIESGHSICVAGLCMGAVLALHTALEFASDIQAIAAMSTTFQYDGWAIPWYGFLLPLNYYTPARYLYSYPEREPYGIKNERLRRMVAKGMEDNTLAYDTVPGVSIYELFKLAKTVKKELPRINVPTLILHSRQDDTASLKNAEYIEHHSGAAYIRKILLNDCYHMITIDNQKDLVADELINFFKEPPAKYAKKA